MYKEKMIKVALITGFLLIFLLSMPFFIIDKPNNMQHEDDILNERPLEQSELRQEQPVSNQEPAGALYSSDYEKLHNGGMAYYSNKDYVNATNMLEQAVQIGNSQNRNTVDTDIYYLAMCYNKIQNFSVAESKFALLEQKHRNDSQYWLARALNAYSMKDDEFHKTAQNYIQKAQELSPGNLDILYYKTRILQDAYNNYEISYNQHDGGRSLPNFQKILIKAYQDLENEAQKQNNQIYKNEARAAISRLQSKIQEKTVSAGESDVIPAEYNPGTNNAQTNINSIPADVQLIENLPVIN